MNTTISVKLIGTRSGQTLFNYLHAGQFSMLLLLFKIKLFKKILLGTQSVSNSLDPDQDRHSFGPDLCSNCLQRLSADNKSHL